MVMGGVVVVAVVVVFAPAVLGTVALCKYGADTGRASEGWQQLFMQIRG